MRRPPRNAGRSRGCVCEGIEAASPPSWLPSAPLGTLATAATGLGRRILVPIRILRRLAADELAPKKIPQRKMGANGGRRGFFDKDEVYWLRCRRLTVDDGKNKTMTD